MSLILQLIGLFVGLALFGAWLMHVGAYVLGISLSLARFLHRPVGALSGGFDDAFEHEI
jgi:hypothetical protein